MRKLTSLMAIVASLALSAAASAQTVPYYVEGSFIGNLVTLGAAGEAVGRHFGNMEFVVEPDGSGDVFDTQTAADGSQLILRRVTLTFDIIPADGGLFNIVGIDEWEIVGGNGRFASAKSSGENIISTFYTPEPVDLSDPTHIPAVFCKAGEIDLGRRNN